MPSFPELAPKVQSVVDIMIARGTGGAFDEEEYRGLRQELLQDPILRDRIPPSLTTCRDLSQVWAYLKSLPTYQARRERLWEEFQPLLDYLEGVVRSPADDSIETALSSFDVESVHRVWQRALERRVDDPEGAITSARTLLETTCKHILDELGVDYPDDCDLPKLYRLLAEQLRLSPASHSEQVFRQILGGCQAVVEGLGALRNRLSDAHGRGKRQVRPAARHAELAVNLAGSTATYLVQTWQALERQEA